MMWIRKITQIKKDRYRIEPEDGFPFVLYKGELSKYGIEEDSELPDTTFCTIRSDLLRRCKMRAMHLLEKQDRTEAQLRSKLEEQEYPQELIEETVSFLYSFHYLDDARYVRNYISYYGRTKSRAEVVHGLMQKGVSKDAIEQGFSELSSEDESIQMVPDEIKIKEILKKKQFRYEEADEKEKSRIYRHLISKGFHSNDVLRLMRSEHF